MNYLDVPAELCCSVERLFRITGFVTTLCSDSDLRPLVFARFYHVRRVAWTAGLLCQRRSGAGLVDDVAKVRWLAWAHDLNRWPFAHNVERGLFDQAADMPRYLEAHGIEIPLSAARDLQGIINKDRSRLSTEARIVLLADMITGFIEDPLWAVTALDLRPSFIPDHIAEYLGIELKEPRTQRALLTLNQLFSAKRFIEPFKQRFDEEFQHVMELFVVKHRLAERLPLGEPDFEEWRLRIKEEFMRQRIFRYNNEKVSKGSLLRSKLIEPLRYKLGNDADQVLTTIDEPETLTTCVRLGVIKATDISRFLPDLDYVLTNEPEMSFRALDGNELPAG